MKILKKVLPALIILVLSIATHFYLFGHPKEVVFDEVHFGKFISGYYSGEYFFDIHPPLAKLLISGVGYLGGYTPSIDFEAIGGEYKDDYFIWLRLLPAIAGALLPLVVYYLSRNVGLSKMASFLIAFLLVFENSLLVQSRFILLDSLLLLFGFGSLLFYFLYRNYEHKRLSLYSLLFAVILAACALSVKWTGVAFLGIIVILEGIKLLKEKASWKEWLSKAVLFGGLTFILYFLFFGIHFALLSKTGPGKDFMTPRFQMTLEGNPHENAKDLKPLGLFGKFIELNGEMLRSNQGLTSDHPDGSKWYSWPQMRTSIYYWVGKDDMSKIYYLGNPVIYWGGAFAIFLLFWYAVLRKMEKSETWSEKRSLMLFILGGFFLNLLPFVGIGRVMFLYHYEAALVFSIFAIGFLLDTTTKLKRKKLWAITISAITLALFIFFAPLTYGTPLSEKAQEARFWFTSWK